MFWKRKTDENKSNNGNDNKCLVRQDSRTNVKTTSAATETINTSVKNATIFNNNTNTVTYQSTRQTVTHTQQARITEIVTRRTPTVEELRELFAQINNNADDKKTGSGGENINSGGSNSRTDKSATNAGNSNYYSNASGVGGVSKRNRPANLNGVDLRHTTSFKRNATSPLSPLALTYESPYTKRNSTIIKTEQTTVTQKNGRSVTQHVEEHRIKLRPMSGNAGNAFKTNINTKTKYTTTANGGRSFKPDELSLMWPTTTTATTTVTATTATALSTYSSPYAKRSVAGGTTYTSVLAGATMLPTTTTTATSNGTNNLSSIHNRKPNSWQNKKPEYTATIVTPPTAPASSINKATMHNSTSSSINKSSQVPIKQIFYNNNNNNNKNKNKLKPGYVYIFNHEKFNDPKNEFRIGSTTDEKALVDAFKLFKCKVDVIKNGTVDIVRKTVAKIESKDYTDAACIVIVILSHGNRYEMIAAKDGDYSIDDTILYPMLRNRTLNNKPKFFFVQACKGAMELGDGYFKDAAQPRGSPNEIYKCYSTFEGYASYRTKEGSIFIQSFCEQLKRYGQNKDIREIMSDVTLLVKKNSQDKQIPTTTSTLTQGFVFGDYAF